MFPGTVLREDTVTMKNIISIWQASFIKREKIKKVLYLITVGIVLVLSSLAVLVTVAQHEGGQAESVCSRTS